MESTLGEIPAVLVLDIPRNLSVTENPGRIDPVGELATNSKRDGFHRKKHSASFRRIEVPTAVLGSVRQKVPGGAEAVPEW